MTLEPNDTVLLDYVVPERGGLVISVAQDEGRAKLPHSLKVHIRVFYAGHDYDEPPRSKALRSGETWTVHGLSPGAYRLLATLEDNVPYYVAGKGRLDVPAGGRGTERLRLVYTASEVSGIVVDENGTPVAHAPVAVIWIPTSGRVPAMAKKTAWTDASGVFRLLGVPAGRLVIDVDVEGIGGTNYAYFRDEKSTATIRGPATGLTLRLGRGYTVRGTVRSRGKRGRRSQPGTAYIEPGHFGTGRCGLDVAEGGVGVFEFQHLRPGTYRVWLERRKEEAVEVKVGPKATPGGQAEVLLWQ